MPGPTTFNPILNATRASIDRHNEWMEKHSRPQRRSKAAFVPPRAAPRTGAFLIVLATLAHAHEANAAIAASLRRQPEPRRPGATGAARGRTEAADDTPSGSAAPALRDPPDIGKVAPGANGGPDVSVGTVHADLSSARVVRQVPSPGHAHTHRHRIAVVGKGLGKGPAAPGEAAHAPRPELPEDRLHGDLPVAQGGVLEARILAAKRLLGKQGQEDEDEKLLELANTVHRKAAENPGDQAARNLSLALLAEEYAVWSRENGGDRVHVPEEARIAAFQEAWSFTLDAPPLPSFKTREKLAEEYVIANEAALAGRYRNELLGLVARSLGPSLVNEDIPHPNSGTRLRVLDVEISRQKLIDRYKEEPAIIASYYSQFDSYIRENLDRFTTAKALSLAASASLGRLMLEHRPEKAWIISRADRVIRKHHLKHVANVVPRVHATHTVPLHNATNAAVVVRMPEGRYGFIGADGSFKYLEGPVVGAGGQLLKSAVLRAFGVGFGHDRQTSEKAGRCLPIDGVACHLSDFVVKSESVDLSRGSVSVKQIMEGQVRKTALAAFDGWKQRGYNPSAMETVLRAIVPFYEATHKLRNDPGYHFNLKDIAWDLAAVGVTVATIGASALSVSAIRSGIAAAKAMQGASAVARASAVIRSAMEGFKTSSFLLMAGRELTDFVIPVFSAKDLVMAAARGGKALASRSLTTAKRQLDAIVARASDPAGLLDRLYESLHKANHFTWARSAAEISAIIDTGAARPIPSTLYRGQSIAGSHDFLKTTWTIDSPAARDDYLAAIIRHSSRTGGSGGEVLSLTADQSIAKRFARGRQNGRVLAIDTTTGRSQFRTIEHIIKYDGPRLVTEGKITAATLAAAIKHVAQQRESEIFFMLGSIPNEIVRIA